MSITVAKQSMGFCPGCGIQVEAGEAIYVVNSRTAHVGCALGEPSQGRQILLRNTEPHSGFLFSETETAIVEEAKDVLGVKHVSFDGATVLQIDTPRLAGQLAKVFELMKDSRFRTLSEIAGVAGCLETSVSARLRDLRKARFGSHAVVSRQVEGSPLLYEYRLIVNEGKEIDGRRSAA
jgi:hypothetical protein